MKKTDLKNISYIKQGSFCCGYFEEVMVNGRNWHIPTGYGQFKKWVTIEKSEWVSEFRFRI